VARIAKIAEFRLLAHSVLKQRPDSTGSCRTWEAVPDSGKAGPDTGKPVPDSGKAVPDTGKPMPDTEKPVPDTGKPVPDIRSPNSDARKEETMAQNIQDDTNAALAKWTPLAATADEAHPGVPVHVVLGEAIDVASMLTHYWDPKTDSKGNKIPGFAGVASTQSVSPELANEIRELQLAVAAAHSDYLVLVQNSAAAPLDQAEFVLGEIRSTLEFVFDDGKQDDSDAQLENLRTTFADAASQDALALALEGYAELASRNKDALAKLDGFDVALIDEARTLASTLRQQSATALTHVTADEQRQALSLRNRLLTLLIDRVKRVRRAAQYVFRNFPDIVRKFTSTYERKQRAARRRAADDAAQGGQPPAPKQPTPPTAS
jgi:hypothetical protein